MTRYDPLIGSFDYGSYEAYDERNLYLNVLRESWDDSEGSSCRSFRRHKSQITDPGTVGFLVRTPEHVSLQRA